jgi:serine/threonine-protein kinase
MPKPDWPDLQLAGGIGNGAGSIIYKVIRSENGQMMACKHVTRATIEHIERARQAGRGDGRTFRLKRSDCQTYFDQVKNEYDVLKQFQAGGGSPHVVKVFELRTVRRRLRLHGYDLLMEHVEGKGLRDDREYPLGRLVDLFRQSAHALIELHQSGYIHADLKPAHVMVTSDGQVKLIDFGQCTHVNANHRRLQGTPEYMAPEQVKAGQVDFRTDVYGLGATMYWALTGRLNRPAMTGIPGAEALDFTVSFAGRSRSVRSDNPNVPKELDELVTACCERRPEKRPQTMREVWEALTDIQRKKSAQ